MKLPGMLSTRLLRSDACTLAATTVPGSTMWLVAQALGPAGLGSNPASAAFKDLPGLLI